MQGFRHRLYPGDPDRDLHGVARGGVRGLLQLRPPAPRRCETRGARLTDTADLHAGAEMFARYAYAPNALGYCGPPLGATLRAGSVDDVGAPATKFSGAWPYLRVLSALTGVADPLDYRLVESYWLGGGIGAGIDRQDFFHGLLGNNRPPTR